MQSPGGSGGQAPRVQRSKPSPPLGWRQVALAVFRAIMVAGIWLFLFLLTFLGYLTIPVALIGAFLVVHAVTAGLPLRWLRRWRASLRHK